MRGVSTTNPDYRNEPRPARRNGSSKSPTGKGWPKGLPREHRKDKDVWTKEDRKFIARWADDVRSEFKRACARVRVFSYLQFNECNTSDGVLRRHGIALGQSYGMENMGPQVGQKELQESIGLHN